MLLQYAHVNNSLSLVLPAKSIVVLSWGRFLFLILFDFKISFFVIAFLIRFDPFFFFFIIKFVENH